VVLFTYHFTVLVLDLAMHMQYVACVTICSYVLYMFNNKTCSDVTDGGGLKAISGQRKW